MSSVLDRSELEQSPLADLHLLANELGVDGFRRLRREELIDAILARQAGGEEEERRPRRGRRGGRARGRARALEEAPGEAGGEEDGEARGGATDEGEEEEPADDG